MDFGKSSRKDAYLQKMKVLQALKFDTFSQTTRINPEHTITIVSKMVRSVLFNTDLVAHCS